MIAAGRAAVACLFCILLMGRSALAAEPAADPLIGLWGARIDDAAGPAGTLTLRHMAAGWRAAIDGLRGKAPDGPGDIRIALGKSAFRGRLEAGGRALSGFWIQPPGESGGRRDPGNFGQPFASPIAMVRIGPGAWRGKVVPLAGHFTLYLKVFRAPDGSLTAAFRNPEMNSNGGTSQFRVARAGDSLRFSAGSGQQEITRTATLSQGRILIDWPDLGRAIELHRETPAAASGFFPRPPGAPPYAYAMPPVTGDGWKTARARDVGLDEAALAAIVRDIAAADPAARPPRLIHSLLVARHGRLVLDEYFFGYGRDTQHDLRSASKTFTSVMLGAAMRDGAPIGPDTRVYRFLAALGPFANSDPRKQRITLAQLMTHSAGLACDDNDDKSPGNESLMQAQIRQPDWAKYTLDLPMAQDPGARYAYCSANINLAGAMLARATRTWLPALFDRDVARPLDFGPYYWNLMPNGEGYAGGGVAMRPRDLLKIGQAWLDGGVWNGRRIVGAAWVGASTAPAMAISPASTGLDAESFANSYLPGADGLAWHLQPINVGGRIYAEYQAGGNGGQQLIVVPELDLAVVTTGGNYGQGGVWTRWRQQIVGDRIIPAIRDR